MNLIAIDEVVMSGYASGLRAALGELATAQKTIRELSGLASGRQLLSLEEACVYLNRDAETLRYYRYSLGLPHYKKGKDGIWFLKSDIDAWLESSRVGQPRQAHSRFVG